MSVRTMGRALAALAALAFSVIFVPTASFADQPKTPQPVATYFAQGLVPRLINLYGSGNGVTKGIDFDATTKVGGISRVHEWTPDFLAGKPSDAPTRLTNDWIAPVTLRGEVVGLATVWINPADDQPELATFDTAELARQIAVAPEASSLVHDPTREAWFALTADALIPLVPGTSGVLRATTPAAYQRLFSGEAAPAQEAGPSGVPIAALVLGIVIVGLAVFVLLPVKKKKPLTKGVKKPLKVTPDDDAGEPIPGDHELPKGSPLAAGELPATETAVSEAPVIREPVSHTPMSQKAPVKKPVAKKPVIHKELATTSAHAPAAKKPDPKTPAAGTPAAKKPAPKTPAPKTPGSKAPGSKAPAPKTQAPKTPAPKSAAKKPDTGASGEARPPTARSTSPASGAPKPKQEKTVERQTS